MKKIHRIIVYVTLILFFYSCKKSDSKSPTPTGTSSDQKMLLNNGGSMLYDITNKKVVWQKNFNFSNAYVDTPYIYTTSPYRLSCIDLNTGLTKWQTYTGAQGYTPYPSIVWPVGNDSLVYVAGDFSASVFAIYKTTGAIKWKRDLQLTPGFNATLAQDPVLVGNKIFISGQHKLFCIDAISGNIIWSYLTDNAVGASISDCVNNNKIYHLESAGNIYCLDLNGVLLWKRTLGSFFSFSKENITVKNNMLYFFSDAGQYALNITDGATLWQKPYKPYLDYRSISFENNKIYSGYGRLLVQDALTGDSVNGVQVPQIFIGGYYQRAYDFISTTSDKILSEMVISGSLDKDTLFIFNSNDLSVYDKIVLNGKLQNLPPIIIENGKIKYPIQSGIEN